MTSSWKKPLFVLIIISMCLAGCSPPAVEMTESPTVIIPSTTPIPPTPTQTPSPIPKTPTPEVAQPTVPVGLRPENAASQVVENGTWVVKNEDGKTTATWNAATKTWDYNAENITVRQILIGAEIDRTLIELFLGPLLPDDPATHFIDPATGQSVKYGIGPETTMEMSAPEGIDSMTVFEPATQVFGRFRGVLSYDHNTSARIIEVSKSADTIVIMILPYANDNLAIIGIADDDMICTSQTIVGGIGGKGNVDIIKKAHEQLVGHMVMVLIAHDAAPIYKGTSLYENKFARDQKALAILEFLSGKSTTVPYFSKYETTGTGVIGYTVVPENQLKLLPGYRP